MKNLLFGLLFLPCVAHAGTITTAFSPLGTITISSGTSSIPIAIDTTTTFAFGSQFPSWSMTIGNGSSAANKAVFVACHLSICSTANISSITIGSNSFNKIGQQIDEGNCSDNELWQSTNPATGSQIITVNLTASRFGTCEAIDLTGVNQTTVWESSGAASNLIDPNITLSALTLRDFLLDTWMINANATPPTPTNGQTIVTDSELVGFSAVGYSYKASLTAGSFSDSYTSGGNGQYLIGALIVPASP